MWLKSAVNEIYGNESFPADNHNWTNIENRNFDHSTINLSTLAQALERMPYSYYIHNDLLYCRWSTSFDQYCKGLIYHTIDCWECKNDNTLCYY